MRHASIFLVIKIVVWLNDYNLKSHYDVLAFSSAFFFASSSSQLSMGRVTGTYMCHTTRLVSEISMSFVLLETNTFSAFFYLTTSITLI